MSKTAVLTIWNLALIGMLIFAETLNVVFLLSFVAFIVTSLKMASKKFNAEETKR